MCPCKLQFFEEAGHYHLPVGHTHEDVDALFGLITGFLCAAGDSLQSPEDLKRLLESKVGPIFAERGEFFHVVLLDAVLGNQISIVLNYLERFSKNCQLNHGKFGRAPSSTLIWRSVLGKSSCPLLRWWIMHTGPGKTRTMRRCLTHFCFAEGTVPWTDTNLR